MNTVYCQECGKEIPIDGEKCPFCNASLAWIHDNSYEAPDEIICATPLSESTKEENPQKEDENNGKTIVETNLPFPLELTGLFGAIYNSFATNGKIKIVKMLLVSVVEASIGVVFVLLGYLLSLGTGLQKGPAIFYIVGGPIICHSFYSIVKYGTLCIVAKVSPNSSEIKTRLIVWFIDFIIGAIFILISVGLDNSSTRDLCEVFVFLGIGVIIGGIISIIKWIKNKYNWKFPGFDY